jgi:hypothetical protein
MMFAADIQVLAGAARGYFEQGDILDNVGILV